MYRGIAVSAGVCRGKVVVLHRARHAIVTARTVGPEAVGRKSSASSTSLVRTRQQITEVQRRVADTMSSSEADIFDAHLLMLEDRVLIEEVIKIIREQKANADFAFHTASDRYIAVLEAVEDEYLRERAADLRDLTSRVLDNLLNVKQQLDLRHLTEPCILVGHDLSPSTTAQLDRNFVLGFATDIGGKTSHTAILARSLDIPAVVGAQNISEELETGDYALLDGYNGTVIVNPTDQTLFEYGQLAKIKASLERKTPRNPAPARRHARRQDHPSVREHRGSERHRVRPRARRGRRGLVPHGISVHQPRPACRPRRSNIRSIARSPPRSNRIPSSSARWIWAATNLPRTCSSRRR